MKVILAFDATIVRFKRQQLNRLGLGSSSSFACDGVMSFIDVSVLFSRRCRIQTVSMVLPSMMGVVSSE
jgi:hypothetical protein